MEGLHINENFVEYPAAAVVEGFLLAQFMKKNVFVEAWLKVKLPLQITVSVNDCFSPRITCLNGKGVPIIIQVLN